MGGRRSTTKRAKAHKLPPGVTPRMIRRFLEELERVPNVNRAAAKAGFKRDRALYHLRNKSPRFAAMWDQALKKAIGTWEEEAAKRAFKGVKRPVFQMGKKVGEETQYSDILAIRMLEAHHPLYRKKELAVEGQMGVSVNFAELCRKAGATEVDLEDEIPEDEEELW